MEGTLVVQTGWDYEDEEVEEMVESVAFDPVTGEEMIVMANQKVTKVKKNQPTATVCRNEDIYIDPTCMDNMDKCQFVIHRYETDLSTLKADGRYNYHLFPCHRVKRYRLHHLLYFFILIVPSGLYN